VKNNTLVVSITETPEIVDVCYRTVNNITVSNEELANGVMKELLGAFVGETVGTGFRVASGSSQAVLVGEPDTDMGIWIM
jgi:hypothetical protein